MNSKFNAQLILKSHSRNVRLINPYHPEPGSSLTSIITDFYGTGFYGAAFRGTAFHCAFIELSLLVLASSSGYLYLGSFM